MTAQDPFVLFGLLAALVHVLGCVSAVDAILKARTSQGAIAWAITLAILPYLALPLYWAFGQRKFHGYVRARQSGDREVRGLVESLSRHTPELPGATPSERSAVQAAERLAGLPFTDGNTARLLIDGRATFDAIFDAIDEARDYILVQFYMVRADRIGRELQARLIRKAMEGVRVYLLYDEIGSLGLPGTYIAELRDGGVDVSGYKVTKGRRKRTQLNFRNHRKIVVVDGQRAYVGGLNVGDEYLGHDPRIGPWRDTSVAIEGPAVEGIQLSFVEDWYWANRAVPRLNLTPAPARSGDKKILVLASGPADPFETYSLFVIQAAFAARRRLWIVSPYFVPDIDVMAALQLAGLRGVDVRIMLPERSDNLLVGLASESYFAPAERAGIEIFRYRSGFLHQKVMLIDDDIATVGTANMDNRSFRLNFELTLLIIDRAFAGDMERMLEADFARCSRLSPAETQGRSFAFRLAVRTARLFAPVL